MGRHSEDEPPRRSGGLRWKGDTTGSIPRIPAPPWEAHEGITDHSVEAFVESFRVGNPPAMDVPPQHARYEWLMERGADRPVGHELSRRYLPVASGYTHVDYPTAKAAALDMMRIWFLWNGIVDPAIRRLHTLWTRHATDSAWSERLDGR
jgi:hypothetical protein